MALISRGTKSASGSTQFQTGLGTILASEVDTDLDTLVNEVNGNLANANIATGAAIELSKIDGYGDTTAEGRTETSPGVSGSESLASTAQAEVERLRYSLRQAKLGIGAKHNNGTTTQDVYYGDVPARGANLARNGSFELWVSSVPVGWAKVGAGTLTKTVNIAANGNGAGYTCRHVATAADEGITLTLTGLKAAAKYEVWARVAVAVGSCRLVTTGADAATNFRNVDITSTGAPWQSVGAVIQTDATPTAIAVKLLSAANLDDFQVDNVRVFECSAEVTELPGYVSTRVASTNTGTDVTAVEASFPADDPLSVVVSIPGPGYTMRVDGRLCFEAVGGASTFIGLLQYDENGGGFVNVDVVPHDLDAIGDDGTVIVRGHDQAPAAGSVFTWRLRALTSANTASPNGATGGITMTSWLTVELIPPS